MQTFIPSEKEQKEIAGLVSKTISKIQTPDAKLMIGGSVGKGTNLPGASDIDFFLKFNYKKYKDKSGKLSDAAETLLKKHFKGVRRLKGSRDYFQIKQGRYLFEIVPVLDIKNPSEAKNLTDNSPLHVRWVQTHTNQELRNEVRKAKQFFRAQRLYGAESYIKGFSGHAIEILTIYYGSLEKLLRASLKWKPYTELDIQKHKTNIDKSKHSPLIVVDPIQPDRNAAAVLSLEKFNQLKQVAKKYLEKPSNKYFEIKPITINSLGKRTNQKLYVLKLQVSRGKKDKVGAKVLKQYEEIKKDLVKHDFKIIESDWYWDGKKGAFCWFYLPKKKLSRTKIHLGPHTKAPQHHIEQFRRKHKQTKVRKGRHYARLSRSLTAPIEYFKKKKLKLIRS